MTKNSPENNNSLNSAGKPIATFLIFLIVVSALLVLAVMLFIGALVFTPLADHVAGGCLPPQASALVAAMASFEVTRIYLLLLVLVFLALIRLPNGVAMLGLSFIVASLFFAVFTWGIPLEICPWPELDA